MTDFPLDLSRALRPTPEQPLRGLTVLVVEDSRFASEAMRLLCLRSGARIRRADCLASAHRHLSTYRPALVIVDLGLPDGSGLELIAALAALGPSAPGILATSGDPALRDAALAAGAQSFLPKPYDSLAAFHAALAPALPGGPTPRKLRSLEDDRIAPDRLALREDLTRAATALDAGDSGPDLTYLRLFLSGLARSSHDKALAEAASRLDPQHRAGVSHLVHQRLAQAAGF